MARINVIGNRSGELTIDPGSSGDSWLQHSNSGGVMFRTGVDDTDGDSYKVSDGSALGTNDRFVISPDGKITMPAQCAFLNVINAASNVTGDGSDHSIGQTTATTSVFDRNGDMTEGDGAGTAAEFTAPVTGNYKFCYSLIYNVPASSGTTLVLILLSNGDLINTLPTLESVSGFAGAGNDMCMSSTVFLNLTASDTIRFRFQGYNGAKTTDIVSGFISGYLVG